MSNLATIVNNILADSGIDDINVVVTTGSYSNPAWITALSWSKITSTPTTLSGYGITDAVPAIRTITINGTAQDLSANRSWSVGTVTSVDMTVPTGFSISGRPITSSGTLALTFSAGYSLPTTAVQSNWTTAYNDSIISAAVSGTTTKTLTLTQQDGGTITASWTDYDTAPVTSVNAGTGISVNQTTGAVTVTNTGVLVNDITSSSGQGRFGGWYQGNGYTGAAVEVGFVSGNGNIISYNRITSSYQPLYIAGSSLYLLQQGGEIWINSYLSRQAAGQGWLSGNYASSETSTTTGAIYSIGGSYYPTGSTLNTMYGVGYTHTNQGQMISGASSWGFYVTGNGTVRVWLGGDNGNIIASGDIYANTSSIVATRTWVNSQGFITGGPYLPLSGGTLSGNLALSGFSNPHITITASSGSYSYLELNDGSSNGYLIKNRSSNTDNGALAGALYLYTDNSKPTQIIHSSSPNATFLSGGDAYIRGQVYVGGNGASTGTQLVYNSGTWGISITGNADTVDGYHATNAANGIPTLASNAYWYAPSWINVNNGGIFASGNDAHFYPNNGSFGSWQISGSRNNYRGIEFGSGVNGNIALMFNNNSNVSGFYNVSYGWQILWENGTFYVYKNSYGGGTQATVLDSSNYNSWAAAVNGNVSNTFNVFQLSYAATAFNPSAGPRTLMNPMSVKMWNNYFNGTGLGSDYGTVMQYYSLGGHVDTQVYFDASGGSWYRTASYAAGWQSWQKYVTENGGTWSINITGSAGSVGGVDSSRIVYGDNATATSYIGEATINTGFKSGFYTVGNSGLGYIPTPTGVNFLIHAAYYGVGNLAGIDLLTNDSTTSELYYRNATGGGKGPWRTILHSGNYNSYAPTLTGGGASGTWGINVTGSAGSASTATYALNSTRLYASDSPYCYGCAAPYYMYMTYDGSRWLLQVTPASPSAVRVAYADSAGSASISSQVTINYNNDSNSTYQMLWGSGNSVYGTAGVYVNPSTDHVYANKFSSVYEINVYTASGGDYLQITDNQVYRPGGGILYLNWSSNANVAITGTGGGYVGVGNNSPSYKMHVSGDIYANGGWLRVSGSAGLYFETYGGGWRMTDSSYIRTYNGKALSMEGASVDYVSSIYMNGGVYIQTNNNRNLEIKSTGAADCGILGRGNGNQFAFQVYGSGGDYGFLSSVWGAWDIRKTSGGSLYMNDNSSYYLNTTSSSVSANINGAILSNSSFGTNGWGTGGNAAAGRVYGPKGAAYSFSGGTIYGAIKIRLPFRNSDGMWSMKVRIYNYSQQQTSEYLLGNYSYDQGAYNFSATYLGGSSSTAFTVRFGNEGGYDCVWIGETGTGWSYPVVSVMDFMMGYSNGNVSNYYQNWDISIVGSLGTVGATVAPNIKFGNAFASYYYDSADSNYYVRPSSLSYMYTVSSFYVQNNYGVSTNHDYGIYFDSGRSTAYAIYRESGAWDFPYPDLRIAFHTGIKIGANASYKGVRFYTDYDMSGLVLSVNNADYNTGGIYVHGTAYASAYYETSDARVKKILEDNSRVKGIESIKPKLYEKDGKTEFGYIAQDFLEIMPYAINNDNKDGYYSLVYREVHTAKIAYLEDSIEEIKAKILYLENQLKTKQ